MKESHRFTYLILLLLKKWISFLSPKSRYSLAIYLASFFYRNISLRQKLVRENIKKAFPNWGPKKIESTIEKTYQFFFNNFIQFISIPKSWEDIEINVIGKNILDKSMTKGKGIILISGHFGAWEILGKWVAQHVPLFTGIAHKQKNVGANRFFQEQRELPGTKHIFKKEPIKKMYEVLTQNGILGLVSDQDAKQKGVFVNFFGIPASTPKGAAMFHLKTGAPIIIGVCMRTGFQKYQIEFLPVHSLKKDVQSITQAYTTLLESFIKQYPEQYFWFHRRWKTKRMIK